VDGGRIGSGLKKESFPISVLTGSRNKGLFYGRPIGQLKHREAAIDGRSARLGGVECFRQFGYARPGGNGATATCHGAKIRFRPVLFTFPIHHSVAHTV